MGNVFVDFSILVFQIETDISIDSSLIIGKVLVSTKEISFVKSHQPLGSLLSGQN